MTFPREITSSNYCIDVTAPQLLTIMRKDRDDETGDSLYNQLNAIEGVDAVDYDGHFGPHIFLRLEAEYDNEQTWAKIDQVIADYLRVLA